MMQPAILTVANRPVYPYSIVPGGVGSQADVQKAMARDPLVAEHYASLDTKRLKPVRLQRDTAAYVSFRKNGKIYWTSKQVKLSAGEIVFLGSDKSIRGRCGNQVSAQPQEPVLPHPQRDEPSSDAFITPVTVPAVSQTVEANVSEQAARLAAVVGAANVATPKPSWSTSAGGMATAGDGLMGVGGGSPNGGGSAVSTPSHLDANKSTMRPVSSESVSASSASATLTSTPYTVTTISPQVTAYFPLLGFSSISGVLVSHTDSSTVLLQTASTNTNDTNDTSDTNYTNLRNNTTTTATVSQVRNHDIKDYTKIEGPPETVSTPEPATWMMCLTGFAMLRKLRPGNRR